MLVFPRLLMRDRRWTPELVAKTASGGKTLSGVVPIVRVDGGGLWALTMDEIQASTEDQVRTWRAIEAMLDGGATAMVVPMREERFFPAPTVSGARLLSNEATNSDDSPLDDDTPYEGSVVNAVLQEGAALRATSIKITISAGAALRGGELFSIRHPVHLDRTYRVASVTAQNNSYTEVTIRPPLREAVTLGTWCNFDYPCCVMQLAEPSAMRLALERRFHGSGSITWVESFPPFSA